MLTDNVLNVIGYYQQTNTNEERIVMVKQASFDGVTALRDAICGYMEKYAQELEAMELQNEAESVRGKIDDYQKGLFSVLFTGGFSAGKSTTLNALIRSDKMHTSSNPETPIITKLVNGIDDGNVQIFFRDSTLPPLTVTANAFYTGYRVDTSNPDKYKEVDFAVIRIPMANPAVQFVDSPGLQNSDVEDRIAGEFSNKADAIVFMVNAVKPFEAEERKYILEHYVGRHLRNVFFVINWYNTVTNGEEEFKQRVHNILDDVFTDENGRLDQELFDRRVFYVDAYQSECSRCHKPYIVKKGMKRVEETPDDTYTGIPEFETAMNTFLSSSDKDRDGYRKYLYSEMAVMFVNAENNRNEQLEKLQMGLNELIEQKAKSEKELKELKRTVDRIQSVVKTTSQQILLSVKTSYIAFVNSVEADWSSYFSENKVRFGLWDMTKIAAYQGKNAIVDLFKRNGITDEEALARDKKFQELSKPIIDGVTQYLDSKRSVLSDNIGIGVSDASKKLAQEINDLADDLGEYGTVISKDELMQILMQSMDLNVGKFRGKANLGQLIIALLFTNPDNAVEALSGTMNWGAFLKDVLVTQIVEVIMSSVVYLIFGPVSLLYFLARAVLTVLKINKSGQKSADALLDKMKENVVKEMRSEKTIASAVNNVEIKLRKGLNKISEVTKHWVASAEQKQTQINRLIQKIKAGETNFEKLKQQFNSRISKMEEFYSAMYHELNGGSIDAAGIRNYAGK